MRIGKFVLTRAKNLLPEEKLAEARKIILTNCDFVLDVGANDGQWIGDVRRRGYNGLAICIEPLKNNYQKLKSSKIESTKFINCAIGNLNGYVKINNASNSGLSSSILEFNEYYTIAAPNIKFISVEKVKIQKLSNILKTLKSNKIFVKIDTQGYEMEVLKSISKIHFNKIYAFEIETSLVNSYVNSTLIEDVIKFLRNRGFKPLRIEHGFGMPNFGQQLEVDILFLKDS
jgi:FkbM family methyltransferase